MPDTFCPKLRFDTDDLACPIFCGIQGTGFPCVWDDNSRCGEFRREEVKQFYEEKEFYVLTNYITDY